MEIDPSYASAGGTMTADAQRGIDTGAAGDVRGRGLSGMVLENRRGQ